MSTDSLQTLNIIEVMENFLTRKCPPENIRSKLDLGYEIEGQSVTIFSIRPRWDKPEEIMHSLVAKATYVKVSNHWKVYWIRADLKWHGYKPKPKLKTIQQFVELVEADEYGCFWG